MNSFLLFSYCIFVCVYVLYDAYICLMLCLCTTTLNLGKALYIFKKNVIIFIKTNIPKTF